jgi:hypothetical protein
VKSIAPIKKLPKLLSSILTINSYLKKLFGGKLSYLPNAFFRNVLIMGLLCRFCGRRKWWLFFLAAFAGGTFLSFIHIETAKLLHDLTINLTHVAKHEDDLAQSIIR